jgi:Sel1 repeat
MRARCLVCLSSAVLIAGALLDIATTAYGSEIQVPYVPPTKSSAPSIIILGPSGTLPPSTPIDAETARLMTKAQAGDHEAQVALGKKLRQARPPMLDDAFKWFQLAADGGNAEGAYNLGLMLQMGAGRPRNPTDAAKWFRVAAEGGNALAQAALGNLYGAGLGVPQDFEEALKWDRLSAAQNNAAGQNNLAALYAAGQGVPPDLVEAMRLYRLAADQGDAVAQANLGFRYQVGGKGVGANPAAAYFWLNLAAARMPVSMPAQRATAVGARDSISARLPPAELARLQHMAAVWKPGSTDVPPDIPPGQGVPPAPTPPSAQQIPPPRFIPPPPRFIPPPQPVPMPVPVIQPRPAVLPPGSAGAQ